jgi:hypothetical protein
MWQFVTFPLSSQFSIHGDLDRDLYMDLYASIIQYLMMGDVMLLGHINAHPRSLQIPLHDLSEDVYYIEEIDPHSVVVQQASNHASRPLTSYGRHLLKLGESHEVLILNGLPCFPESQFFTCRPHGGGASVVDYVLTSQTLLPFIHHFFVTPLALANHALLNSSL